MIDITGAEQLRSVTQQELGAEHLPDDNNLLAYLQAAGYLTDDTLTGYLPGALYYYHGEPDAVEIMADRPFGERALTTNGGPRFNYEFPHRKLNDLCGSLGRVLATDTGHIVEDQEGSRFFIPKGASKVELRVRREDISQQAIDEELERLSLSGIVSSTDYISEEYRRVRDLTLTRAIRTAAMWASYTHLKPETATETYPRTLTVDEAQLCLRANLQDLKNETVRWDMTIIKETL